jgi:hypothetical protein
MTPEVDIKLYSSGGAVVIEIVLAWSTLYSLFFFVRVCVCVQQINQMIAEVDKDGSGTIDLDEFVHMMTDKMGERDARDELHKAFRIIDQDGNVRTLLVANHDDLVIHSVTRVKSSAGEDFRRGYPAARHRGRRALHAR